MTDWPGGLMWYNAETGRSISPTSEHWEKLLCDGELSATGYRVVAGEKPRRETIPTEFWRFLHLDASCTTAGGGGVEYVGLDIEPSPAGRKAATGKSFIECQAWIIEELKAPRRRTKEHVKDDALRRFAITDRAFERAWRVAVNGGTTHATWKKRGPVKKLSALV